MFIKKTIAGITVLITIAAMSGVTAFAAEDQKTDEKSGFKTGKLKTYVYEPDNAQELDCRFYDALPSIPYVRLSEYYKIWADGDIEITDNKDGTYGLKVPYGTEGKIDVNKDILTAKDRYCFFAPEDELAEDSRYNKIYADAYEGDAEMPAVESVVDFSKYDIDIFGDDGDIWMPAATLCDVFSSDYRSAFIMENSLYFTGSIMTDFSALMLMSDEHIANFIEQYNDGRPEDLAVFNYNELCLGFDFRYGFPGQPVFTPLLKEKGLDGMLSEGNDTTRKIKELLLSTNLVEYTYAFDALNYYLYDGGHTDFISIVTYDEDFYAKLAEFEATLTVDFEDAADLYGEMMNKTASEEGVNAAREAMIAAADNVEELTNSVYIEKGDTAIFYFDAFDSDLDKWVAYYHENGEMPEDIVTEFYTCIQKADENPKIKKFVIDLGTNEGGMTSVVEYMMGIMDNWDNIHYVYTPAGVLLNQKYKTDKNFDKVIDEKDTEYAPDLKYGIITSNISVSSANWLSAMARDSGILIMGEQSGGGTCALTVGATADGVIYSLSSGVRFTDKDGGNIDSGIKPDVENVVVNEDGSKDYSATYNFDNISKSFDTFYGTTTASSSETETTTTTVTTTAATESSAATETAAETTTKKTETAATTTAEQQYFAPLSKMGDYAKADYKAKTGKDAADTVTKDNRDGTYSIILSDDKGNVLETYTIDPATGKGKNSRGEDVDLPQTGNNSMKNVVSTVVAVTFMTVGAAAVYVSGVGRKKKDDE